MKILIAGFGNMGSTYAGSFIASRFILPGDLYILSHEISEKSFRGIPEENFNTSPGEFVRKADIIILAVKPQDFDVLADQLKPFVHGDQLILSIMAGIKIDTIKKRLNVNKVVRSMPNLPAQIGMGMTVFTTTNDLDRKELFIIQNLINTTGKSVYVESETLVDAATAVSGSGPAYVYFFMSAMIHSAVKMGFTPAEAELLVNQTFMGAVHLHNQSNYTCMQWIDRVASKGGTTEAALEVLTAAKVNPEIENALFSAFRRAKELGK